METLIEQIFEDPTRAAGRQKALGYYDNPDVPRNLRAQAAFVVAQSYFLEQRTTDACRYNGIALGLAPSNEQYQKFKQDQSCP